MMIPAPRLRGSYYCVHSFNKSNKKRNFSTLAATHKSMEHAVLCSNISFDG